MTEERGRSRPRKNRAGFDFPKIIPSKFLSLKFNSSKFFFSGPKTAGALWALVLFLTLFFLGGRPAQAAATAAKTLKFGEMYGGVSSLGIVLSDKLKSLAGQAVVMEGFMAPPLKPTLDFFVLTRVPMSLCPFCSSDADWPSDIVVVYLEKPVTALPFDRPIRVEGRLELGTKTDGETGFVSLVRIYATRLREAGD